MLLGGKKERQSLHAHLEYEIHCKLTIIETPKLGQPQTS